jgi:hypothetical protein
MIVGGQAAPSKTLSTESFSEPGLKAGGGHVVTVTGPVDVAVYANQTSYAVPDVQIELPTDGVAPALVKKFPDSPVGAPGFAPAVTTIAEPHSSFVMGTTWAQAWATNSKARTGMQRIIGYLGSEGSGRAGEGAAMRQRVPTKYV